MMLLIKQCEDLLFRWDKRIQFEATLLFFFSIASGSSFISLYMFWGPDSWIMSLLPFFYLIAMFSWWYVCKRMTLDTQDINNEKLKYFNSLAMCMWLIISFAVSFGSWDEWGWNTDESFPFIDNIYRFINCLLVTAYICTLTYDFYIKIESRNKRIKIWMFYIWIHGIISCSYFGEWVSKGYNNDENGDYNSNGDSLGNESMGARWLATLGSFIIIILGLIVFFIKKMNKYLLATLFIALIMYWWGTAALDCDFYADAADMTVMPGYQMLWSMAILILLESVPTMANDIYVLGGHSLLDDEEDDDEDEIDAQNIMNSNNNNNPNVYASATIENKNDNNDNESKNDDNDDNDDITAGNAGIVDVSENGPQKDNPRIQTNITSAP